MISISTKDLSNRKTVEIDGHPYHVRELGAGDELALSQASRQIDRLQDRLRAIGSKTTKDAQQQSKKASDEIIVVHEKILSIYAGLFDDGGDGSKSRSLVGSLSFEGLREVLNMIFAPKPAEETEKNEKTRQSDTTAKATKA